MKNLKIINCNKTVFQHKSLSYVPTIYDVKNIISKSKKMNNELKKEYFIKNNLNLDLCVKYIDKIEKLEKLYNPDYKFIVIHDDLIINTIKNINHISCIFIIFIILLYIKYLIYINEC